LGPKVSWTVPEYNPLEMWDLTDFYWASLMSLGKLTRRYGYFLLYAERSGINASFVHEKILGREILLNESDFKEWVSIVWRPAGYPKMSPNTAKEVWTTSTSNSIKDSIHSVPFNFPSKYLSSWCHPT